MTRQKEQLAPAVGRSIFGDDARQYHGARADYPPELYSYIAKVAPFPIRSILEIGAGTGLATQDLLRFGPMLYRAVEPDPKLAAYLAGRFDMRSFAVVEDIFPGADVTGPFDLIAAASSFHWTDQAAALDRIRGMLPVGGILALWWNVYRQPGIGDAFADAVGPLLEALKLPPSEGSDGHYSLEIANRISQLRTAGFTDTRHALFRRERSLSASQARSLFESYSFVRAMAPADRTELLDAIERIVIERFAGAAPCPVLTPLYIAHMR